MARIYPKTVESLISYSRFTRSKIIDKQNTSDTVLLSVESQLESQAISEIDDSADIEAVCSEINSLREESQQITELLKLEEYYSREVIEELKQIMRPGKSQIPINSATISTGDSSVSGAILTSEGIVCLLNDRGKVLLRRPLGEFQDETFLNIIDEILPEVKNLVIASQEKSSEGLSTIERISRELRKIVHGENTGRSNNAERTQRGAELQDQS